MTITINQCIDAQLAKESAMMDRVSLSEVEHAVSQVRAKARGSEIFVMDATSILIEVVKTALALRVAERACDAEEDIGKIREVFDRLSECIKANRAALAKVTS